MNEKKKTAPVCSDENIILERLHTEVDVLRWFAAFYCDMEALMLRQEAHRRIVGMSLLAVLAAVRQPGEVFWWSSHENDKVGLSDGVL